MGDGLYEVTRLGGSLCSCKSKLSLWTDASLCRVLLQVENVKNNLLLQLEILGRWLAVLVAIIAVVAFLLAMFHAGNNFKTAFESAVAIAVAIIPEGLPAMVGAVLGLLAASPDLGLCLSWGGSRRLKYVVSTGVTWRNCCSALD